MKVPVVNLSAEQVGEVELDDSIFGLDVRSDLIHRLVVYQLAKRRSGTRRTKTRAEISRTGKKLGKQKGSGRARHGSMRAPIFVGGGRAHGPVVRSHAKGLQKKVRNLAIKHVLSSKLASGQIKVIDNIDFEAIKTSQAAKAMHALDINSAVIISDEINEKFALSVRNLPRIELLPVGGLNGYDVMNRDSFVMTKDAVSKVQEMLS